MAKAKAKAEEKAGSSEKKPNIRELVLDGIGGSAIVAATGISERHAFRLKAQHRAGRMRIEGGRSLEQPRRESKAVARERRRIRRELVRLGLVRHGDTG